jgi:hypothetical protein
MSSQLVSRSADLTKLVEEGYDIEIRDTNLLVHHVPYRTSAGSVGYGILVSELSTNGEETIRPSSHQACFVGGIPYNDKGQEILVLNKEGKKFGDDLVAACELSAKRNDQHPEDYFIKITTYADALGMFARALDPTATHADYPVRADVSSDSVFRYHDAATSRAGISAIAAKLKCPKLAIVGLGGTGSYILDLIAKTDVEEIHLFDGDEFYAHNAFRSPGAAAIDELRVSPRKVDYLFTKYDPIRSGIVTHPYAIDESTVDELREMSFVFLAMDTGPIKKLVVERLTSWGIPLIDSGMNVRRQDDSLRGMLRVSAGEPGHYEHLAQRLTYQDDGQDEYDINIQTGDLNMMNAAMAVIKWKKLRGYYTDNKREYGSTYTVARNQMCSGEVAV